MKEQIKQLEERITELERSQANLGDYGSIPSNTIEAVRRFLPRVLFGSATLNFPNTLATNSSILTITVYGAKRGDIVALGNTEDSIDTGLFFIGYVTAQDTVTIRFMNLTSNPNNPGAQTVNVAVIQLP